MADFKIKSAVGTGNKTLLQSQDQTDSNYAIQIGDGGATTLTNATLTNATITAGTFPSGHIIQTKQHAIANASSVTSDFSFPSTAVGFDNAIKSTSDVLVMIHGTVTQEDTNTEGHTNVYLTGGGFGSGTSGTQVGNGLLYRWAQYNRESFASNTIDTTPGSTTPTYSLYFDLISNLSLSCQHFNFILMEIAR